MIEREHKNHLLFDLKENSSNLQKMIFRVRSEPMNTFETSAIHPSLKFQFQLEEKTIQELGVNLSTSHSDEHAIILEKSQKLQKQWEQNLISSVAYAGVVMGLFLSHRFKYDDALIDSIRAKI